MPHELRVFFLFAAVHLCWLVLFLQVELDVFASPKRHLPGHVGLSGLEIFGLVALIVVLLIVFQVVFIRKCFLCLYLL